MNLIMVLSLSNPCASNNSPIEELRKEEEGGEAPLKERMTESPFWKYLFKIVSRTKPDAFV